MLFLKNQSGTVLPLTALMLPIILGFGVLALESGQAYIRQSEINQLAYQAANTGLVRITETLEIQAKSNYQRDCNVEEPPSKCSSSELFSFLSASEISAIVNNETVKTDVIEATEAFVKNYDPQTRSVQTSVVFPFNASQQSVGIEVTVTDTSTPQIISGLLPSQDFSVVRQAKLALQ